MGTQRITGSLPSSSVDPVLKENAYVLVTLWDYAPRSVGGTIGYVSDITWFTLKWAWMNNEGNLS